MSQHTVGLKSKFEQTQGWTDSVLEDQHYLLEQWQSSTAYYSAIAAIPDLAKCVKTGSDIDPQFLTTLADLIDPARLRDFAEQGQEAHKQTSNRIAEIASIYDEVEDGTTKIVEELRSSNPMSASEMANRIEQILEEFEVLTKKMDSDCQTIQALPDAPKSLAQAQRMTHIHDNTFVSSLIQTNDEVAALFLEADELRTTIPSTSQQLLQRVSQVESKIGSLHQKMNQLTSKDDSSRTFKYLNAAVRLPFIYGSLLIECIRRQEWTAKRTTREAEEMERRRKWSKEMDTAVDTSTLDSETTAKASRVDLDSFLASLERVGFKDVLADLKELVKDLDAPSRRMGKAFKNGSLHEAAFTGGSVRGEDKALENLKKEKTRSDEKLKSAESRIRKLEDLLHRQTQNTRPNSMAGLGLTPAPSFERNVSSPEGIFVSALSRAREEAMPIVSSRRTSFNNDQDKSLAQRVVSLEADLLAQKARAKEMERSSAAKQNAENMLKEQVREAMSTKEDLLSNFEAQQREFDDERRLANDENKRLTVRLEEIEDELERVYANHEHEFKIQALEHDLDSTREEAETEIRKAHEQAKQARIERQTEREVSDRLRHEITSMQEDGQHVELDLQDHRDQLDQFKQSEIQHRNILLTTLRRISPDEDTSDDMEVLVQTLSTAVVETVSREATLNAVISELERDIASRKADLERKATDLEDVRRQVQSREADTVSLRAQIKDHESHRSTMSTRIASLEAGHVEATNLGSQIESKDLEIDSVRKELTASLAKVEVLNTKLEEKRSELSSLQGSYVRLDSARETQAHRTDDLSSRLYVQNSKLQRLLEQLNFNITSQDGKMSVQRISSKTMNSTILGDPAASMKRSSSGQMLSKEEAESMIDPKVLHWSKPDGTEEAYEQYIRTVSSFDTDVFHEAIYKRMKEVEHIARKTQRDVKTYRERSHRAQAESHERLSLRAFKEGDLALFLPTKDQATKPWAAFNVGAPHYFLREQDSHKLSKRDWMIARISKVEKRVVDLSRSMNGARGQEGSIEDENPYELSDGLRWYLLDAAEEKPGAPISIGSGKSTITAVNVEAATATLRPKKSSDGNAATKTLTRSLDSRRSSTTSKRSLPVNGGSNLSNEQTATAQREGEGSADQAVVAGQSEQVRVVHS